MTMVGETQPPAKPWWHSCVVVAVMLLAALAIIRWHQNLPLLNSVRAQGFPLMMAIDSDSYLAMAREGPAKITSPFTKRFLYPWLAGKVARATSQPYPDVFAELNLLSLLVLAFCVAEILRATIGQPFLALVFLLTPFPLECFELGYLPDLFHMAFSAAFFLLLARQKIRSALVILFLAFLSRENTMVLSFFTAALAWYRGRQRLAFGAAVVLLAGLMASAFFSRLGQPNIHHLPDFLYLLGKVPYYFLLSFFGIRVWSNVRSEVGTPFVTWHLPPWLHIGADNIVGLTHPDWRYPVSTAITLLTIFGVGPLMLCFLARRMVRRPAAVSLPFAVELALVYGLLSYLIGPLLGDWVDRLVGYGWPAFWIALPYLFYWSGGRQLTCRQTTIFASLYFISCWWPRLFGYGNDRSANPWPCFAVLIFYFVLPAIIRNTGAFGWSKKSENPSQPSGLTSK